MVRTRAMSLREENEPEILVAHDSNEGILAEPDDSDESIPGVSGTLGTVLSTRFGEGLPTFLEGTLQDVLQSLLYRDAEEDEDLEAAGEVSSDSDEDSDDNLMEVDDDTDSDFEMIVAERRRRESERELQMELERERSEPEGGLVRLPISEKKLVFMFVYKDDLSSDQFLERVLKNSEIKQKLEQRCILWGRYCGSQKKVKQLNREINSMYGMRRLTKDLLTGLTIFWLMERNGNFKILSSHKTTDLSTPEMFMQVFDANSLQFSTEMEKVAMRERDRSIRRQQLQEYKAAQQEDLQREKNVALMQENQKKEAALEKEKQEKEAARLETARKAAESRLPDEPEPGSEDCYYVRIQVPTGLLERRFLGEHTVGNLVDLVLSRGLTENSFQLVSYPRINILVPYSTPISQLGLGTRFLLQAVNLNSD